MGTRNFQIFVGVVALLGAAAIAHAALEWRGAGDLAGLAAYALLALAGSMIKVRIPGLTGTVSLGFLAVLTGVALMSLSETVLVVTAAGAVQSLWAAAKRPRAIQVIFNSSLLAASTWVAYIVAHAMAPDSPTLQVAAAVAPLYLLNAGAVAALLSLLSTGTLSVIWEKFQIAIFPCYLVGAVLAMLITQARIMQPNWTMTAPLLALAYLSFNSYRTWMRAAVVAAGS